MNSLASVPTAIPIDLSRLDSEGEASFDLKLQFRGWSDSASTAFLPVPDHVVPVALNGTRIGEVRWHGRGAAESELWTDSATLQSAYRRGNSFSVVYGRLQDPALFAEFKDSLTSDPQLSVRVEREPESFAGQSRARFPPSFRWSATGSPC